MPRRIHRRNRRVSGSARAWAKAAGSRAIRAAAIGSCSQDMDAPPSARQTNKTSGPATPPPGCCSERAGITGRPARRRAVQGLMIGEADAQFGQPLPPGRILAGPGMVAGFRLLDVGSAVVIGTQGVDSGLAAPAPRRSAHEGSPAFWQGWEADPYNRRLGNAVGKCPGRRLLRLPEFFPEGALARQDGKEGDRRPKVRSSESFSGPAGFLTGHGLYTRAVNQTSGGAISGGGESLAASRQWHHSATVNAPDSVRGTVICRCIALASALGSRQGLSGLPHMREPAGRLGRNAARGWIDGDEFGHVSRDV
ncbi:exported protein of unknown function [Candidatus Hydrogenisulfobacillus filiaventi]|uniref:Uncharacterized protein n=1 Tax=Candidatus Hydrogenisulfobacillus filiaventi TaxID=2707344 RepID=A0A6F8ZI52_9FIRM|nr:exported protein of unknown function [Candidatus Hydrogenisulfobacillus filiaventi]